MEIIKPNRHLTTGNHMKLNLLHPNYQAMTCNHNYCKIILHRRESFKVYLLTGRQISYECNNCCKFSALFRKIMSLQSLSCTSFQHNYEPPSIIMRLRASLGTPLCLTITEPLRIAEHNLNYSTRF